MSITLLPTPPSRQDPNNFAVRADAFLGALPTFGTEANALATAVNTNATNAATSATASATSATNAATSATNAATSATNAAASYDSFDDRYLGSKTTNPTLDNDSQALLTGALYWNSASSEMRVWNGTAWVAVQTTTAATNAATSATAAATSATNAATSATNAAASYDSFDDRYLGSKATNPTLDNDSAALLTGALYWNSASSEMRVWNGTAWVAVQTTTAATNAATSATAAATSATNAATSATNAAASYDSFDDRYLGSKTTNPTLDNDSEALLTGALYWNSASSEMRVWNGTAWVAVQTTTAATDAATSATAAATSATNAATSATSAAASYDSFDDRYLGSKATNPTTDNDSQTLLTGALYWNSASSEMRVWNGTAWVAVQTTTAATNAATSATAAATSAAAAAASFDSFDDRYLGSKATAPTVDNDGATLLAGALYWNSTSNGLFVWNGAAWVAPTTGVTTFNGRNGVVTLVAADVTSVLNATVNFTAGIITATDFNSTSDQQLKTNISTIDPKLLASIVPVSFNWKDTGEKSYGVIAQDLQKTIPELVHTRSDGLLGVSYIPIIAMLVQAVKDLQDKVNQLESR